jgi:hypothetical protein
MADSHLVSAAYALRNLGALTKGLTAKDEEQYRFRKALTSRGERAAATR